MMLSSLGEFGLIEKIRKQLGSVGKRIGDDCAVVPPVKGWELLTTDALVEGTHFRRAWLTPEQIGMKAIESNVSDVLSKGGIPKYALVSLVLPASLPVSFVMRMYTGMKRAAKKYHVEIAGGNLAEGKQIVVSVAMTGEASKPVLRSGAKPGDFLLVSRPVGGALAGLRCLQRKKRFKWALQRFLYPQADMRSRKIAPYATAMIDISDGLLADLGHLCDASKVGAKVYADNLPIEECAQQVASALGEDAVRYALSSGEEYALLYTLPEESLGKTPGFLIGEITSKKKIQIRYQGRNLRIPSRGYEHFTSSRSD